MEYLTVARMLYSVLVMVLVSIITPWTDNNKATATPQEDGRLKLDKAFSNYTRVLGSTVRCHHESSIYYPYDSWTCHNMTIQGKRLRYWYVDKMGAECGDNDHGTKFKGENDVAEICREMLGVHGIDRTLWAAVVNKASCEDSRNSRIIFKQNKHNRKFEWHEVPGGTGYVISLQCVVMPAK